MKLAASSFLHYEHEMEKHEERRGKKLVPQTYNDV